MDLVPLSVTFGLLSALTWGAADFGGGRATRRGPVFGVVLVSQVVGIDPGRRRGDPARRTHPRRDRRRLGGARRARRRHGDREPVPGPGEWPDHRGRADRGCPRGHDPGRRRLAVAGRAELPAHGRHRARPRRRRARLHVAGSGGRPARRSALRHPRRHRVRPVQRVRLTLLAGCRLRAARRGPRLRGSRPRRCDRADPARLAPGAPGRAAGHGRRGGRHGGERVLRARGPGRPPRHRQCAVVALPGHDAHPGGGAPA